MRMIFFVGINLLTSMLAFGQVPANYNADNEARGTMRGVDFLFRQLNTQNLKPEKAKIKGSRYLNEGYMAAEIYSADGLETSAFMRYDAFSEEIQIKMNKESADEIPIALLKRQDFFCKVNGTTIVFKDFLDDKGELQQGYLFQLAETTDFVIYERRRKLFRDGKKAVTSFELDVPSRFVGSIEMYCRNKGGNTINHIKSSKKGLLQVFNGDIEKQKKVKDFLAKSSLDFKSSKDVVQLFYYYDNL